MTQKIAAPLKRKKKIRARKNMTEADKNLTKILDEFPDILERIAEKMKTEKLDPWVKKFSGLVSTGKHEDEKSVFD